MSAISRTEPWYSSPDPTSRDTGWMERAIQIAERALPGDMPFGCIIVSPDGMQELARTWGTGNYDPLNHSEMVAIHLAADKYEEPDWLRGCTLYSTHEPCPMCCGGINHAKLSRVIFGSYRSDLPDLFRPKRLSEELLADTTHPPVVIGGVLRERCVALFTGVMKWD